ncbi:DUF3307 domain-containing protein [Marinibacterium profundimaris]|uniref:DUF3307 domain-containing protein n=1 Tax=Marinibacterium profundimaris TaxID=1679460 RepID=A0A225NET4_9RHOB|nr:DUF3307 domain-containing protein [Marinibacterium profundimaris]OWU70595.1 hypothetical protein ATO3_20275 [Marinibacterium profundimaris]
MGDVTGQILILLVLLQIKHMFADFYLQTPRMLSGRETYVHLGRAEHAGVHALGSMIVFVLMGTPVLLTLLIVAAEWIVHFHIDWAKARWSMCKQHTPSEAGYWRATGADQFGHQLTYLAMAWAWWMWAA